MANQIIKYIVRVNETGEEQEFTDLFKASVWADKVHATLSGWGGKPTFTCIKETREVVDLVRHRD